MENHGVIEEAARQGVSIIGLQETGGEYVSQTRGRTNRNDDWEKLLTGYDPKYYNPSKQWQTATNSAQNMRIAWDPNLFKITGGPYEKYIRGEKYRPILVVKLQHKHTQEHIHVVCAHLPHTLEHKGHEPRSSWRAFREALTELFHENSLDTSLQIIVLGDFNEYVERNHEENNRNKHEVIEFTDRIKKTLHRSPTGDNGGTCCGRNDRIDKLPYKIPKLQLRSMSSGRPEIWPRKTNMSFIKTTGNKILYTQTISHRLQT